MQQNRPQVIKMNLDRLRPLVKVMLDLDEWPGDWEVAGKILTGSYFNFQRGQSGEQLYGITLFGERVNGTGIDEDPLVAIYRAYLLMRLEEAELEDSP